jgi:predicted phosphate transport protein (TIGR00153 family)
MLNVSKLFGKSPFGPLVEHARKVHACVAFVKPISEAILVGDMEALMRLQHDVSKTEYEADLLKDSIRQNLPDRYYLPVAREDIRRFLSQVDHIADGAQDFAVVATFRKLSLPRELHEAFRELVDKVISISETLLAVAVQLADLQKEAFAGAEADEVLLRIQEVCQMEWESDKLSRKLARLYYNVEGMDIITIILLEKLCAALRGIADSAEHVGKNLRLMINRK